MRCSVRACSAGMPSVASARGDLGAPVIRSASLSEAGAQPRVAEALQLGHGKIDHALYSRLVGEAGQARWGMEVSN
jgi:hypothetical protein